MPVSVKPFCRQSGSLAIARRVFALICVACAAALLMMVLSADRRHTTRTADASGRAIEPSTTSPDYEQITRLITDSKQDLSSTIVVPIAIDLAYLEEKLNEDLPVRLTAINETKVCVKAKWLKTKVPHFDGFKIKSRMLKTKVSPEIRCNIRGYIDRLDKLALSGSGDSLLFSLPVHATVTAKAGISETAVADATFFASATIAIDSDWQPRATVDTDFKWDRRPELELFNLVKVTFGSKVEPALRKQLQKFEQKIPRQLSRLDLKDKVQSTWDDIQQPVKISSHPAIYSSFTPDYIGYTGFEIENGQLTSRLIIRGQTTITGEQSAAAAPPVPLLPLMHASNDNSSFRLVVPTIVEEAHIQSYIDRELEEPLVLSVNNKGISGTLTIHNFNVNLSDPGTVTVTASIDFDNRKPWLERIDYFDWFSFTGNIELNVDPQLDSENSTLSASDVQLRTDTSSTVADTLTEVLNLPLVKTKLSSLIHYDFSADINKGIQAANTALNSPGNRDLELFGQVQNLSIDQLIIVDGALAIVTVAEGKLQATLGR